MRNLTDIPAFYVANFLDFSINDKDQQQRMLLASEVSATDPTQLISLHSLIKLIENVCLYNPSPRLGVEFGRHLSPISHGILSQAAISSGTLRDIVNLIAEYTVLRTPLVDFFFVEGECVSEIHVTTCVDSEVVKNLIIDIAISCIVSVFEFVTLGSFNVSNILLARDKPLTREERLFSRLHTYTAKYKENRNSIVFSTLNLGMQCSFADKDTFNEVLLQCESELTQLSSSKELKEQIKKLLEKDIIKFSSCSNTADYFNVTTRTLRRRLEKQGQSYQMIVDEFRQTRAEHLLIYTPSSISQIAEAVGFHDASSFGKSFRRKAACSPSQFRYMYETKN